MAMHHVIVVNTDRTVDYEPDVIGRMVMALTRTCGGEQEKIIGEEHL